jgi:hypothetical protein
MDEVALPDVILCMIAERTKLCDALSFACTCRLTRDALTTLCRTRLDTQLHNVINHFPDHIIDSLPMHVWLDLEWTEFRLEWMGTTDYIDCVTPRDVPGHPFKCCLDMYGRLAVLMRRQNDVAVLFQRYSDETNTWVFASDTLPIGGRRLSDTMVARLSLWLTHECVDFHPE